MKFLAVIFAIIFFSSCAYAEVYKCQTLDGKIYYQASPCNNDKGETLKLQEDKSNTLQDIEFKPVKIDISIMRTIFEDSKPYMAYTFKDPSSVRYRGVRAINIQYFNKEYLYFCGEVNAKNSYGGYAGYEQFFSRSNGVDLKVGSESFPLWVKIGNIKYNFLPIISYCFSNGEYL